MGIYTNSPAPEGYALESTLQQILAAQPTAPTVVSRTATINAANDAPAALSGLTAHKHVSVQVDGTFVGTLAFESSNDGTTWYGVPMEKASDEKTTKTTSGTGMFYGGIFGKYFRVKSTTWTSGTATVNIALVP